MSSSNNPPIASKQATADEARMVQHNFIDQIKAAIQERGLRDKQVADRMGMPHSAISDYLTKKKTNLTIHTMVRLCRALDLSFLPLLIDEQSASED